MKRAPTATLDPSTQTAIAAAYGLGEPVNAIFVARGAMGAVNRLDTTMHGMLRAWTVKRSYWHHFTEPIDGVRETRDYLRCIESVRFLTPMSYS